MLIFCDHNRGSDRIVRVFLDGSDVTNRCFAVNVQSGFVGMYVRDDAHRVVRQFDSGAGQWISRRTFRRGEVAVVRANGTTMASWAYAGRLSYALQGHIAPGRPSFMYPGDPSPDPEPKPNWLSRLLGRIF